MPTFEPNLSEFQDLWEWLKKRRPDDHKLFELWILLKEPDQYRPNMERQDLIFKRPWVDSVISRTKVSSSKLAFLRRAYDAYESQSGGVPENFNRNGPMFEEVLRQLEPVLEEIKRDFDVEAARMKAERRVADAARAKQRLDPARRKQIQLLATAKAGYFWFTSAAPDDQPYIVLSSGVDKRPPPTLIGIGKTEGRAGDEAPAAVATGTWTWDDGTFYVSLRSGTASALPLIGKVLGGVKTAEGTPRKATARPSELLKLAAAGKVDARGPQGHLWFVASPPGVVDPKQDKPLIVISRMPLSRLQAQYSAHPHVLGTWSRDGKHVRITLVGPHAGDRALAQVLATTARAGGTFGRGTTVELHGTAFELKDSRAPKLAPVPKAPVDFAITRRKVDGHNRGRARDTEGELWFGQYGRDDKPIVVLHRPGAALPFLKADLASIDPAKARLQATAEWSREKGVAKVNVTVFGLVSSELRDALDDALVASGLFVGGVSFGKASGNTAAFAALRRSLFATSTRLEQADKGNFWFLLHAVDGQPLLVLYQERNFPHRKDELAAPDPAKARLEVGGTWERNKKDKAITFDLVGPNALALRTALRLHLGAARLFRETRFVVP